MNSKKVRPCLIIGLADYGDVIICQITSRNYRGRANLTLKRSEFKTGSIVVDSFIRPDKIVTVTRSRVNQVLGTVTDAKLAEVKKALARIFELDKTS